MSSLVPPDYQLEEDRYAARWVLVHTGPHRDHGGWRPEPGGAVCRCGAVLTAEGKAAA